MGWGGERAAGQGEGGWHGSGRDGCSLCTACALCVHCVCTACALRVHRVCTACAPRVHCMCTARALQVHCMCTACALLVHTDCACSVHLEYGQVPLHALLAWMCPACSPWSACALVCTGWVCTGCALGVHCTPTAAAGGVRGQTREQTYSTRRSAISGTPAKEGAGEGWTRGFLGAICIAMWEWLGNDCAMLLPPPPSPSRRPPSASLQASGFDPVWAEGLFGCCCAQGTDAGGTGKGKARGAGRGVATGGAGWRGRRRSGSRASRTSAENFFSSAASIVAQSSPAGFGAVQVGEVGVGTERVGRVAETPVSSAGRATGSPTGHAGPLPRAPRARKYHHRTVLAVPRLDDVPPVPRSDLFFLASASIDGTIMNYRLGRAETPAPCPTSQQLLGVAEPFSDCKK